MINFIHLSKLKFIINITFITTLSTLVYSQISANETRYVRIGSLQNHYTAYGSERAWNSSYYEGLQWPAEYPYQDNSVIERNWIGTNNFIDQDNSDWEAYVLYFSSGFVGESLFPVELKQSAKFTIPVVQVDGENISAPYEYDVDEINPNQIPDRIVTNIINTSMGVTVKRTVYAFSQQYHDNYHIKIFTYINTGNTDYDNEIERHGPIYGFRVGRGIRYSVNREGAARIGDGQVWGKHTWVTKRGENYVDHYLEPITLTNPIVDWIRCGFCWAGQSELNDFDNIGGPYLENDGRLTVPHHAGIGILHVDKSISDKEDDPYQPSTLGWHAGDTYPLLTTVSTEEIPKMVALYSILSGEPYNGMGGNERFYENYIDSYEDPWLVHNDMGGTNLWINYGPFDLYEGDSIVIVEVEGVNGINRQLCESIGKRWKQAYLDDNDNGPFYLPDGSLTTDEDEYKNSWVFTGQDSILLTFSRAKRNFDLGFNIPLPPHPPPQFEVNSSTDKINLSWLPSPSEGEADFAGYKIYRSENKPDTTFDLIGVIQPCTHSYIDSVILPGTDYYYYILTFNDGSNNLSEANPHGSLHSNKFYTRTTKPAFRLGTGLDDSDQRILNESCYLEQNYPNPFNPNTTIGFNIPSQTFVSLSIFNLSGQLIDVLINEVMDKGYHRIKWSPKLLNSGVYFYQLKTTTQVEVRKCLFMK
jgi:hypothetical protein